MWDQQGQHMTIVAILNNDAQGLYNKPNYFYEHGRCYTFRPKEEHHELPPGSQYGYKFMLNYKYRPIQFANGTTEDFKRKVTYLSLKSI